MGEVRGHEIFFVCIHIWIPHQILSILSIHTIGTKCGPDLLNILAILKRGGVLVSRAAAVLAPVAHILGALMQSKWNGKTRRREGQQ